MSLSEEKMRILKLLEEKKISAEEAAELLEALEETEEVGRESREPEVAERGRALKIKVTDKGTGKLRVNVAIPLRLAKFARMLVPSFEKYDIDTHGIDIEGILEAIDSGIVGKILEVDDEANNQHVEIWIE